MTETQTPKPGQKTKTLIIYGLMLVGVVAAFFVIRAFGETLSAPPPTQTPFGSGGARAQADALLHVLIALAVVVTLARAVGAIFHYMQQPAVIGEILAGILLGPSLLGRISPKLASFVLPMSVAPFLQVISQVGVILYMFLVGLELDPNLLRKRGHTTLAISHASIVTPFLLGALLALLLYPRLSSSDVPFTVFALFLGVSMSVTAFPVLARILTDRRIHRTRMGVIALTCAAVDDVTAWCLLALVVSIVQARMSGALLTFVLAIGYVAFMFLVVRPGMERLSLLYGTKGRLTQGLMATIFVSLLLSALATDLIGIHALFGAFLLGAIIPHDSGMARELTDRLEDLVVVLLLPAFFAFTGMRTQIGLVSTPGEWLLCGLILVVASLGKFGGSAVAARLTGLSWREGAALGILMNTRGLMELIVLNIGLDLKVISPALFAMLVVMALVTTFLTTPLLHLLTRGHDLAQEMKPQVSQPHGVIPAQRQSGVLVPISNPTGMAALIGLASAATRPHDPEPRVLALVRRPPGGVRSGLREIDRRVAPRTPIVVAAMDYARQEGLNVDLRAVWTDDPAGDILAMAEEPQIGWLIMGHHRPVFGADLMGGVVKQILDRVRQLPLNVGVVIHSHERPLQQLVVVVDHSEDGKAALDLAIRIAQTKQSKLQVVLIPGESGEPAPELIALLKDAGKATGRWLYTDVLRQRSPASLAQMTHGDLVVMGTRLADEMGLPLDDEPGSERCVVVVRAGGGAASGRARVVPELKHGPEDPSLSTAPAPQGPSSS